MAFNWQTFKTRTLTAIVFAIVMLVGLLWNAQSFVILFIIIHFGCWYEFVKLLKKMKPLTYGYFLPLGLLYITLPFLLMIDLLIASSNYDLPPLDYSPVISCEIIFSLWINDTMAYIIGSLIGKTPLTKISPKKTWEGTIGGFLFTATIAGLIAWGFDFNVKAAILISVISAIAGTFGDLLESKLKRMAGVKDSGHIMPGHGGFLDRFDSMLLAIPAVWLYVYFFMR